MGHFVTLIEICMHLIRVNPGHICVSGNHTLTIIYFLVILQSMALMGHQTVSFKFMIMDCALLSNGVIQVTCKCK